jgi:hypothetical protein
MKRVLCHFLVAAIATSATIGITTAASITIPNGDFESYDVPGVLNPAAGNNWSSEPGGDGIVGDLDVSDEYWTATADNARWGLGWSTSVNLGGAGLNHPDNGRFRHTESTLNTLNNLFGGYFIGHLNVRNNVNGEVAVRYAQSGTLGQLAQGRYVGSVAVGFTRNQERPDVKYTLELVTGHTVDPGFGSLGGTAIPGNSLIMETDDNGDSFDTNEQLLTFVLDINGGNALIGVDYAIRITAENTGLRNGVVDGFTVENFSQATFDNVRLELVPEPCALSLACAGIVGGVLFSRRRSTASSGATG